MRVIKLFDIYFLILMLYVSSVLVFWDHRAFLHYDNPGCAKISKYTGIILAAVSMGLFILKMIIS